MYTQYSKFNITFRRVFVVLAGLLSLPVLLLLPVNKRTRMGSFLHRYWVQTSAQPLWLKKIEQGLK
ncbi:DUF2517 domain-containing protein [Photobacterium angustum]|uniref:DUF2517 domain-containing protein n=1 Tax=Photobacterium angustum TaxID=661 RepID=A0A2T3Q8U7_PHOAN|nr:DUF2517 family protein [Photobacterium angustum]KJG03646.1 hypothetical protein UB35_02355 [Photobacterium angustum]KJG07524.1 hypothetical protein UB33_04450 [Photobacterium angustum]KJG18663.1 hypothetical protein UA33_01050 [Photobacterium angustum]KJG25775.1 hypothetical protein UA39_02925 [Photobacterium angustum]KJG33958.1 hypothetical protein UA36_02975 [Photobacterium angustum]